MAKISKQILIGILWAWAWALTAASASAGCKSIKTILFTAFDGFPGKQALVLNFDQVWAKPMQPVNATDNNSYRTVAELRRRYGKDPHLFGYCTKAVFCLPVPTEHLGATKMVENCIKAAKPDDVYMVGQGYCESINYETASANRLRFTTITDNAGFFPNPNPGKIDLSAAKNVVPSTLPLAEIACGIEQENPFLRKTPTTFGVSEGNTFVCNSLAYQIDVSRREEIEKSIGKSYRSGFIHVPSLSCPGANPVEYAATLASQMKRLYSPQVSLLDMAAMSKSCIADKSKEIEYRNASYDALIRSGDAAMCIGNGQTLDQPEAVAPTLKNVLRSVETIKKAFSVDQDVLQ